MYLCVALERKSKEKKINKFCGTINSYGDVCSWANLNGNVIAGDTLEQLGTQFLQNITCYQSEILFKGGIL